MTVSPTELIESPLWQDAEGPEVRTSDPTPASGYGLGRAFRVAARHWLLLSVWCLLCGAAAYWVGKVYSTPKWRAEGSILYTPLNFPGGARQGYNAPNAETVSELVKSPRNMEALCEEFGLTMPTKLLAQRFVVTRPPNTDVLSISLDWAEPTTATAMVNRLTHLSIAGVVELRRKRIEEEAAHVESALAEAASKLNAARAEHLRFLQAADSHDLKTDAETVGKEVVALNAALNAARQRCEACAAECKTLDELLASLTAKEGTAAGPEPKAQLNPEHSQRLRTARDSLEEARAKGVELKQMAAVKQRKHDMLERMIPKGAATRDEVDTLAAEVRLLNLQRENCEKTVRRWEEEVRTLPVLDTMVRADQAKERHAAARREAEQTEADLAERRKQAKALTKSLREEAPILARVAAAEKAVEEQEALRGALRRLLRGDAGEFAVISPATPSPHPVSSDRKMITAAAFAGPVLTLFLLLVGLDWLAYRRRAESALARAGLPLFARPETSGPTDAATEFRRLALRISQQLAGGGKVVVLHAAAPGDRVEALANEVGRYLWLRRERVLGVDARLVTDPAAPARSPGLADYLLGEQREVAGLLRLPYPAGVDFLPPGRPVANTDLLACRALAELLASLREEYDRILVLGPPAAHTLECEMLAVHADAILLVAETHTKAKADDLGRFARSLKEAGAPLLGAAILP